MFVTFWLNAYSVYILLIQYTFWFTANLVIKVFFFLYLCERDFWVGKKIFVNFISLTEGHRKVTLGVTDPNLEARMSFSLLILAHLDAWARWLSSQVFILGVFIRQIYPDPV